jgi:hypothetical protein
MSLKYGRKPAYSPQERPRLMLGPALQLEALPPVPAVVDELTRVADWPMYLNDRIGDCTIAAVGHMIEATTTYGRGTTVKITDDDVVTAYSAVSGYDPKTGANDNGAVMQDVLDYWRKVGIGGHRILAFAELDVRDLSQVAAALYLFGHVYTGLLVPKSAEDQFDTGRKWTVVTDDGGIQGGHAVDLGYRDTTALAVVTWGSTQLLDPGFWAKYMEEAWVVIDQDWIDATGGSPPGLDTAQLNAAFTAITHGQPGPFPVQPTPTPPPAPPGPGPVADTADRQLVADLTHWLGEHHIGDNAHAQAAVKRWKVRKGL